MKRMRWFGVMLATSCLIGSAALGQEAQNVMTQPSTIRTSADGKYEAPPDTAMMQFNLSAQDSNSKAAYDRVQRLAQQLRDMLRANGIDPAAAQIGFFSLEPMYDWKQPQRKIVGYRVSTDVSLKLKDFSKAGALVQQLGDQELVQNINLSYTLEDMDAAKQKAVEDAFQKARAEAATLARAGERTLGELLYASVDTAPVPVVAPMLRTMAASAQEAKAAPPTAEFTPNKITVNARVTAVFGIR